MGGDSWWDRAPCCPWVCTSSPTLKLSSLVCVYWTVHLECDCNLCPAVCLVNLTKETTTWVQRGVEYLEDTLSKAPPENHYQFLIICTVLQAFVALPTCHSSTCCFSPVSFHFIHEHIWLYSKLGLCPHFLIEHKPKCCCLQKLLNGEKSRRNQIPSSMKINSLHID